MRGDGTEEGEGGERGEGGEEILANERAGPPIKGSTRVRGDVFLGGGGLK